MGARLVTKREVESATMACREKKGGLRGDKRAAPIDRLSRLAVDAENNPRRHRQRKRHKNESKEARERREKKRKERLWRGRDCLRGGG